MFRDITPLLLNAEALAYAIGQIAEFAAAKDVDGVAAAEIPDMKQRKGLRGLFAKS